MTLDLSWISYLLAKLLLIASSIVAADQTFSEGGNGSYSNASHLLDILLKDYDIRLRPGFGGPALMLEMEIVIASFDSMSEVNMDYTVTMYLHQYWRDERLSWGKVSNESMTLSGDFSNSIWVPDTFLANDKRSFLHDVTETNKMLRLYGDGSIAYGMRFTSTLACNMNLRYYPLDSQNCTVEVESYGYTTEEVYMQWKGNVTGLSAAAVKGVEDAKIPQFSILGYDAMSILSTTATGSYQRLRLTFMLQRAIGYFIFQTYLPCILIVMLSWVSFWINHEATSARVALGITTVLTMTTISTGVRQSLPRISYVKSIDIYLVMCFVFVFAALLEYAAVNYSYWGSRAKKKAKNKHLVRAGSNNEFPGDNSSFQDGEDEEDMNEDFDETMGMTGGRLSPIPSLRSHPSNNVNLPNRTMSTPGAIGEGDSDFPDYPRTAFSPYVPGGAFPTPSTTRLRFRGGRAKVSKTVATNSKRARVLQQIRRKARAVLPRIRDINLIDKYRYELSFLQHHATPQ